MEQEVRFDPNSKDYVLLSRGAEAIVYVNKEKNLLVKFREPKHFRIKEIDGPIRKYRTRREARIIDRLHSMGLPVPNLVGVDENKGIIIMEYIEGKKLRDIINTLNFKAYSVEVGKIIALLHKNNVIHGDLTTSNFLVDKNNKLFLIDFGLSYINPKVEDKAVDIHLLRQALESKHFEFWDKAFKLVLDSYQKNYEAAKEVIDRLSKVEKRGRYKRKDKKKTKQNDDS